MGFIKYAKIPLASISSASFINGELKFSKTANKTSSIYRSGSSNVDVGGMLRLISETYDISKDPQDYIYEAARAVTAEVPNYNGDGFPRNELLRFDHRLGKAVYQTFILKPHHINHRADNPKTSRGVVLDASYNDMAPALDNCPGCGTRTAAVEERDATGLHCKKCGQIVKDEFVELLLAIDTKKDPTFADGVRSGSLDSLSMGCFIPGTQVQMADATTKSIELIKSGDWVRTHNGNIAEVSELSTRDFDSDIITLKVAGCDNITLTPNHPVWIINQDTGFGEFIHADHVTSGMWMLSPKLQAVDTPAVDFKLARLAGYFISEGNFIKGYGKTNSGSRVGLEFTFNIAETRYADEVQNLLNDLGYDSGRYERPDKNTVAIKAYRCPELASKMFGLVGEHAHSKVLSDTVLNWPKDAQMAFVGAWLNGDGSSQEYGATSRSVFVTVSRDAASQLSQILINNDIPNCINIREHTSGFGSPRPAYDVVVGGDAQVKFSKVSDKIKRQIKNTDAMMQSRSVIDGTTRLVKRVTRSSYRGPVHNFEVLHADHSYVAGGVAVHNCEAGYTDCSICDNRARSVAQFCSHIKSGKKKQFKTASGMRMSFEKCGDVVFTEISRVDQPADPTARQRELFNIPMSTESDMLIMATKIARLEDFVKIAQAMPPAPPVAPAGPAPKQPNQSYDGDPAKAPPGDPNEQRSTEQVTDPTRHETIESLTQLITELSHASVGLPNDQTQKELSVWQKALSLLQDMERADEKQHGGPAVDPEAPAAPAAPEEPVEPPPAAPGAPGMEAHLAQANEISPQVPFKTLAESIKWAESSVYKLKAENHRLTGEREARSRDASASGRPFLAWENASFTAQIKTNGQYIDRLGKYISKARELEASGNPWGKDLTRSMSRFFANKQGQHVLDDMMTSLDEVAQSNPEMVEMIKRTLGPDSGVAEGSGLNDYLQKREDLEDQHVTTEEMGIRPEEDGSKMPSTIAARQAVEKSIASDLNDIMGKENQVASKELKFAGIYKDVKVSVTKVGNVRVATSKGNLFIVRPAEKPQNKADAMRIAHQVLANIAEHGITQTILKYDAVIGPKMAQVLEHHIEDFDGGREDGDKGPITDDHETNMDHKFDKPKDSLVDEENTDRADEVREHRDQSNADVLEKHQPDHKDALPKGIKNMTDNESSDMAEKRKKPSKNTLSDVETDRKDLKPKKSAEWEKPWEKKEDKGEDEGEDSKDEPKKDKKDAQMAPPPGATGGGAPPPAAPPGMPPAGPGAMAAAPGALCALGAMCSNAECPEHGMKAQGTPGGTPGGAPPGGPGAMPMAARVAAQKHQTRLERLYKSRLDKVSIDNSAKLAAVENTAINRALSKLVRAMKLAAKRQELNVEYSPLKAAMHDVLSSEQELDEESFYPGMDDYTASKLVETTASNAFTDFTDSLIKRASEFLKMSDEAFSAIESDVKNIQPAPIQVQASVQPKPAMRQALKTAAMNGNFVPAAASSDETISSGGNRDNIRSALNTTKVQRTSQVLKK